MTFFSPTFGIACELTRNNIRNELIIYQSPVFIFELKFIDHKVVLSGADPGKLQGEGHESKWCPLPITKIKNSSDFGHFILVVPYFQCPC